MSVDRYRSKWPRTLRRLVLGSVLLFMLLATAYGFFRAGTWEDDPGNWERAFETAKPADVLIPHSWYWRRFSLDPWNKKEVYFLQFRWNERLFEQLTSRHAMNLVEQLEARPPLGQTYCVDKPGWFPPESAAGYETWIGNVYWGVWLFREKETKELFFHLCNKNGRAPL